MPSRMMSMAASAALVAGAAWLGAGLTPVPATGAPDPVFGDTFWQAWGDGAAEVSSYDLTFPRYGEPRPGLAVTIFVTETFSDEARVKADPGVHAKADEFPVLKLNLVQDFSTGIYDYNLMTSVFTALAPFHGRGPGAPAKVAFSSQEWCGTVYHQLLPGSHDIRSTSHSYFDQEGDRSGILEYPAGGVFEDALYHWARGFSGPRLDAGKSVSTKLLRSVELVRLKHVPDAWDPVTLSRSSASVSVEVPAGTFDVDTYTATVGGPLPRTWTFLVETAAPHRIVRWETGEGRRADLVASERLRYWEMNGPSFRAELSRLGLTMRPPRTP